MSTNKVPAFIPLESDPVIMTTLLRKIGLNDDLEFHDVYGLQPDLLDFIPKPIYAVLLLFPVKGESPSGRGEKDTDVIWIKQRIKNACGSMALLHAVLNGPASAHLKPNSTLDKWRNEMPRMDPLARAELIESSEELRRAHQENAQGGQTIAPNAEEDVDLHYICFVQAQNGFLYQMDGGQTGPIKLDKLGPDEGLLGPTTITILQEIMKDNDDLTFNIVALAPQMS